MSKINSNIPQFEKCVICGEYTGVLIKTPIKCRKNYVAGCGQLCEKCAGKIANEQDIFK